MKTALMSAAAVLAFSALTGCVVAPVEPVAYRPVPPPPPPVVVVRPAYGYYSGPRGYYWRRWH